MKTKLKLLALVSFLSLGVFAAADIVKVAPEPQYGDIGKRVVTMLPRQHILSQRFDDEMSRRAWTNLVTRYDMSRSIFLQSDLDAWSRYETSIDDDLRKKDVSFGYEVQNVYAQRLKERVDFVTNMLTKCEFDFSINESYSIDRKDAKWPKTREEAEELWRKRIKNELLAIILTRELNDEKKSEKGKSESQSEDDEDDEWSDTSLSPQKTLIKKYLQFYRVSCSLESESVLQNYLSAVCMAYDPHTDYMSPMTEEDFEMSMNLKLCGVGAVLQMDDGALKISEIMPGGPIAIDGRIKKGDKIISVKQGDGEWEDITWLPINKSVRKIRGPKGSQVTLELIPREDPTGVTRKKISLIRDEIKLEDQAATGYVHRVSIDGRNISLGYINLPSFYGTMDKKPGDEGFVSCSADVAKYLAEFNSEGVEGLLLDMRGNGGGSLKEAILLSALFVPSGPVVLIKDRQITLPITIPSGNPVAFKKPIIVLIDRASASAAEIVAGHLRDVGRAIVLGDVSTHGKGTVQSVMDVDKSGKLGYGSIKITTARFYRITGESTQVRGVKSDIHLPSILDHLDIGEDKLPNALPFEKLNTTSYKKVWNLNKYIRALKEKSNQRVANDSKYKEHIRVVNKTEEIFNRKEITLERNARKEIMREDRNINAEDDEKKEQLLMGKKNKKDNDVVLNEAFNVLGDLVELVTEPEMPKKNINIYDLLKF